MKTYTQEQVNKKFKWKYVDFYKFWDYVKWCPMYEIRKTSKTIRENMTLWEDVWTSLEFTR